MPAPAPDALPLPAPVGLLHALLIGLFVLHVIPMSVTLGGGFWALAAVRASRRKPAFVGPARTLGRSLPLWTAATVTTGVAALLFLQVLYGHLFYAAAIAMAWPQMSIVLLVIAGYYAYYFVSLRAPSSAWPGMIAWACFVLIGFVFTHQMTLMLSPERIHAIHVADPSGANLHWVEPTLWPRYLHMLVGALALAALWPAALGARLVARGDESGRQVVAWAARRFVLVTTIEMLLGVWWILALPDAGWRLFVGQDAAATAYFGISLIATVGGLVIVARAARAARPGRALVVGAAHMAVVVIFMVLMRDVVRRQALATVVDLSRLEVEAQWGAMTLFGVLLVAGLSVVGWMVRAVARGGWTSEASK
jgi:hypothetical protein